MNCRENHLFSLFVLTLFCNLVTITSDCSIFSTEWTVFITNTVQDAIEVHIKSTDHDLGNQTIPSNFVYSWSFCDKLIGTKFTGDFWWGPRFQTLALMDREIMSYCRNGNNGGKGCFWLVNFDGFYVSPSNAPFPTGWKKKQSW